MRTRPPRRPGTQYTFKEHFDPSREYDFSPSMSSSMSRSGCPYDNTAMENFFGTLKTERLYGARFTTGAQPKQLVAEYINYERMNSSEKRPHSCCNQRQEILSVLPQILFSVSAGRGTVH